MGNCSTSRNAFASAACIFFFECVTLLPSKASPKRQPLTVCAKITDGRPLALQGALVAGVHLAIAVATAAERADLLVTQVADELQHARIAREEGLAHGLAGSGRQALPLAVDDGVQVLTQHAFGVARE